MPAYYDELDPYAAQWLRNLIAAGHIAPGDVDERSIVDVRPDDLAGYDQCHFFAGIGGWSLALRLAGWPDDRPVWTGSCPCQPFSAAGKRKGVEDERHLWPAFFDLIRERRPPIVFGEQVASAEVVGTELEASFVVAVREGRFADANRIAKRLATSKSLHFHRRWIDGVSTDLEGEGYAVRREVLGAHSAGAPHIRQRLWWVADAEHAERRALGRSEQDGHNGADEGRAEAHGVAGARGEVRDPDRRLADADGGLSGDGGLQPGWQHGQQPQDGGAGGMGDADDAGPQGRDQLRQCADERAVGPASGAGGLEHATGDGRLEWRPEPSRRGAAGGRSEGFWDAFDLLPCTDGKARRVEPGTFPLAHGVSNRVGRLRAYGNAIVPQVGAEFIAAFQECRP